MADTLMSINYIVKTPGNLGGDPRIAGRRIGVHDVVNLHIHLGAPLDEIAQNYSLTLAEIHAALAYYYDHTAEIEAIITENQHLGDAIPADPREAEMTAKAAAHEEAAKQGTQLD